MAIKLEDLISQKEAAEIRGVSIQAIHYLVKMGRFTVVKVGNKPFLIRSEVEKYEPRPRGRPRKKEQPGESKGKKRTTRKKNQ